MSQDEPKKLRQEAAFLRHVADEAERRHQPPAPIAESDFGEAAVEEMRRHLEMENRRPASAGEAVAALIAEAQEFRDEEPKPLHVRLRAAAKELRAAADALEEAQSHLDYADDLRSEALGEAKKADWYDDLYVGYCESFAE